MPEHRWMAIGGPFSSAAVLVLLLGSPALAQDAGALLRQQQIQAEQDRTVAPAIEEQTREAAGPLPTEDAILLVTRIRFTGNTALLSDEEQAALASLAVGKRLGLPGLEALRDEVTANTPAKRLSAGAGLAAAAGCDRRRHQHRNLPGPAREHAIRAPKRCPRARRPSRPHRIEPHLCGHVPQGRSRNRPFADE